MGQRDDPWSWGCGQLNVMILVEKNDVHHFTETVIESGSRTLVTELMMKETAHLLRKGWKRV